MNAHLQFFRPAADVYSVADIPTLTATKDSAIVMAGLRFVVRQPIFDRSEKVFGYELLFRDGIENYFRASDADAASRSTVDSSLLMGLAVLCDGRRAFVNCTRDVLLNDHVTLLPSDQTIVEILESVKPDGLVLAAAQHLQEAGLSDRAR